MDETKKPRAAAAKTKEKGPRGAEAWLAAAWTALAREGVDGVRVERLAVRLGVTKGSFYWHFADRRALLDALLDDWERRATTAVIARVDGAAADPRERLHVLLRSTAAVPGAPHVEQSIRAFGLRDKAARRRLERVDARREAYVASLLEAAGVPPDAAAHRARALYLALIGEYARVAHGGPPTDGATWDELVARMLPPDRRRRA